MKDMLHMTKSFFYSKGLVWDSEILFSFQCKNVEIEKKSNETCNGLG
jgi:hypothetical protein